MISLLCFIVRFVLLLIQFNGFSLLKHPLIQLSDGSIFNQIRIKLEFDVFHVGLVIIKDVVDLIEYLLVLK